MSIVKILLTLLNRFVGYLQSLDAHADQGLALEIGHAARDGLALDVRREVELVSGIRSRHGPYDTPP